MLTPQFDTAGGVPLYEQLYRYIKSQIEEGILAEGTRLPSKRHTAEHLSIAINTVTAAYEQLVDEGYLRSEERRGYFVENLDQAMITTTGPTFDTDVEEEEEPTYRYDFSLNVVDAQSFPLATWRSISREILSHSDADLFNKMDPRGLEPLRHYISNYLHDARGLEVSPERIVVSAGTEYLFQILFSLFGEEVFAMENPGYERLNLMFEGARKDFVPIDLDESGMDVEELRRSGAQVACVSPSHQFPTGITMPMTRRLELMRWATEEKGRYIIEDDYDSEFRYGRRPIPPLKTFDQEDVVVYMGTFSKSIFPGIRTSYMVLPESLLERFLSRLSYFQCPVPTLMQEILAQFIRGGYFERHLNRMRKRYRRKWENLVAALQEELPEAKICGEAAGMHLLLSLPWVKDEEGLVEYLGGEGIHVRGLHSFCVGEARYPSGLVLGFGALEDGEIHRAVAVLADEIRRKTGVSS